MDDTNMLLHFLVILGGEKILSEAVPSDLQL